MNITPPFGFTELVPVDQQHRIRRNLGLPAFYATQNAIPVSIGEMLLVMRDQPIVFTPLGDGPEPTGFVPVAVCGLSPSENLLMQDGQWDPAVYLPAYLRRHPFCVAFGPAQGDQQRAAILCVEKSALSDDGDPVANPDGTPTPAWQNAQNFVSEVENDFARTQQFSKLLFDLKLLEGFSMTSTLPDGQELKVSGMYRVSEEKLKALPADQLRMLIERGVLRLIYMHLTSIERFPSLIDRRVRKTAAANDAGQPQA